MSGSLSNPISLGSTTTSTTPTPSSITPIPSSTTPTPSSTPSSTTTSSISSTTPLSTTLSSSTPSSALLSSTSTYTTSSTSTSLSSTANANTSSSGFFHNTAAVAGTFAGAGVVVLILLIWIIVACVRRSRAKKFDDIATVAAKAAADAHSPALFEDEYPSVHAGIGGMGPESSGMSSYSDLRNATVTQPLLSHEAYGMSEAHGNPYYSRVSVLPGAAGIGAGGAFRANSQGDPYAARFTPPVSRYGSPSPPEPQTWDDVVPAVGSGYGLVQALSQQQQQDPSLVRNKSQGNTTLSSISQNTTSDNYFNQQPMAPESYADHYKQGFDPVAQFDPYAITPTRSPHVEDHDLPNPFALSASVGIVRPNSGGVIDDEHGYDDPHRASPGLSRDDDDRMSLRDEEDYGAGRRVLKVANE